MEMIKYYWLAVERGSDSFYRIKETGTKEKRSDEIDALALRQGVYHSDSKLSLQQLINHWNESQAKDAPFLWLYSMTPFMEEQIENFLEKINRDY